MKQWIDQAGQPTGGQWHTDLWNKRVEQPIIDAEVEAGRKRRLYAAARGPLPLILCCRGRVLKTDPRCEWPCGKEVDRLFGRDAVAAGDWWRALRAVMASL